MQETSLGWRGESNGTNERKDNLLHSHGADGTDVYRDGIAAKQRAELNIV